MAKIKIELEIDAAKLIVCSASKIAQDPIFENDEYNIAFQILEDEMKKAFMRLPTEEFNKAFPDKT